MANIGLTDVGYAPLDTVVSAPGRTRRRITLTIPNTTNITYPAGGIPLQPGALGGLRGIVASVKVIAQNVIAGDTNPLWNWNGSTTAPKLEAFQGGSVGTAPFREYTGNITQNSAVVTIEVEAG
jgi:hypothetical protein